MRVIASVYGVGERKKGIGKKSGKKYDFTEVSIGYPVEGYTGERCETVAIDANIIGDRVISPGDTIDLVMHQANFKTYVDAIL